MLLTGSPIKNRIKTDLTSYIEQCKASFRPIPHLAIVIVGQNPRSLVYIEQKKKFAHSIGAAVTIHEYPETITVDDLEKEIVAIGGDNSVHGILVQMPLPTHMSSIDARRIIDAIPMNKDADGLTTMHAGKLATGSSTVIIPATTRGVLELCKYYDINLEGADVVVIGRSNLVGKPTALAFLNHGATVSICHSKTKHLRAMIQAADVVVSATGVPQLITADMVHSGQYIIDVGITVDGAGNISGDVDTTSVEPLVKGVSPVPGGVGPLTVCGLFMNLCDLHKEILDCNISS